MVEALVRDNTGNLFAAVTYGHLSGNWFERVYKWSGNQWTTLAPLDLNCDILALACGLDNTIYIGGCFTDINGYHNVYRWDTLLSNWQLVGGPTDPLNGNGNIMALCVDHSNNIYAGGFLKAERTGYADSSYVAEFIQNTGLPEPNSVTSNYSLFPNPCTDIVKLKSMISSSPSETYQIFDYSGRIVKKGITTPENTVIPVGDFPPGFYFIKIREAILKMTKN